MLIDARTLPTGETIQTEVCIVGAGPAGITLAREFAGQDFRVCLLESGKLEPDEQVQSLYQGELTAKPRYPDLDKSRRRQFGGTSNQWDVPMGDRQEEEKAKHNPDEWAKLRGARLLPMSEADFEKRDWMPHSGWSIRKADLDPFYERARSVCQMGSLNLEDWEESDTPRLPLTANRVTSIVTQHSTRAVFTVQYRDEINRANNITTYLNANVVEIETNETAQAVTRLRVACLEGGSFWVTAKIFILATGGIENARLLLLSDKIQKTGLGNQNDLVGRFYMDHPVVFAGALVPKDRQIFNSVNLYDLRQVKDTTIMGRLVPTDEAMRQEPVLNFHGYMIPQRKGHGRYGYTPRATRSLKSLVSLRSGSKTLKHLGNVVTGLDEIAANFYQKLTKPATISNGWSALSNKDRQFSIFEIYLMIEQPPHPDNRVTLIDKCDRLGCRQAKLNWRWGYDLDLKGAKQAQKILAQEFARSGIGELELDLDVPPVQTSTAHHHIGTTRMHSDPKQGVVDVNCQVHGVSNLFVTGCSVFPTGGYANPTFTIIAMAVRLADHVKTVMAENAAVLL